MLFKYRSCPAFYWALCRSKLFAMSNSKRRQSELIRPIPQNSMVKDLGCASKIYFDNAGDDVTLTLYNVTLTSQNHVTPITSVIAAKETVINEVYVFFNKILLQRYFIEKYIKIDFNSAELTFIY